MKKGSREFFEVFRRGPQKEKPTTWWQRASSPPAATQPAPAQKATAAPPSRGAGARPNRVVLSLSHEAIVVFAVVLVGMLVVAFVWGHSVGVAKQATVADAPDAAVPQKALVLDIAQPEPMKAPYYTLRVMGAGTVMNAQRAQEIVDFLRSKNYDAFVLGKNGSCTVNVGRFARTDTADAQALKQQIYSLVYRNQRWFTSCSWHKVTAQER